MSARLALHAIIEHAVLMAIHNADTAGREETRQPTFGAPSPADPLQAHQQLKKELGLDHFEGRF